MLQLPQLLKNSEQHEHFIQLKTIKKIGDKAENYPHIIHEKK